MSQMPRCRRLYCKHPLDCHGFTGSRACVFLLPPNCQRRCRCPGFVMPRKEDP